MATFKYEGPQPVCDQLAKLAATSTKLLKVHEKELKIRYRVWCLVLWCYTIQREKRMMSSELRLAIWDRIFDSHFERARILYALDKWNYARWKEATQPAFHHFIPEMRKEVNELRKVVYTAGVFV